MEERSAVVFEYIGRQDPSLLEGVYEVYTSSEDVKWLGVPEARMETDFRHVFSLRPPFEAVEGSGIPVSTATGITVDLALKKEREEFGRLRAAVLACKEIDYHGGGTKDEGGAREAMIANLAATAQSYENDMRSRFLLIAELQRRFRGGLAVILEAVRERRELSDVSHRAIQEVASKAWNAFRDGERGAEVERLLNALMEYVAEPLGHLQGPGLRATLAARDLVLDQVKEADSKRLVVLAIVDALKWKRRLPPQERGKIEDVMVPDDEEPYVDTRGHHKHNMNKGIIRALIVEVYDEHPDWTQVEVFKEARERYDRMLKKKFGDDFNPPLLDDALMRKYFFGWMSVELFGSEGWQGPEGDVRLRWRKGAM